MNGRMESDYMNKEEFSQFAMALKTYYPREEKLLVNQQAMGLWYMQLQDLSYDVASAALNKWVALNKWSPSIADIRSYASSIVYGDIPDWGEAWELVLDSIRRFGMYRKQEGISYIGEHNRIALRCAERIGYDTLCMSENLSVERANFRMMYDQYSAREDEKRQLPNALIGEVETIYSNKDRLNAIRKDDNNGNV